MTDHKPTIGLSFLEQLHLGRARFKAAHSKSHALLAMNEIISDSHVKGEKDPLAYYHALAFVLCAARKHNEPQIDEILSKAIEAVKDIAPILCNHGYTAEAVSASGFAIKMSGLNRACNSRLLDHCCS